MLALLSHRLFFLFLNHLGLLRLSLGLCLVLGTSQAADLRMGATMQRLAVFAVVPKSVCLLSKLGLVFFSLGFLGILFVFGCFKSIPECIYNHFFSFALI